jgi:hypothetical protein
MPGFERLGEEEKRQILDVLDTGVLFRYEFGDQRNGIYKVKEFEEKICRLYRYRLRPGGNLRHCRGQSGT